MVPNVHSKRFLIKKKKARSYVYKCIICKGSFKRIIYCTAPYNQSCNGLLDSSMINLVNKYFILINNKKFNEKVNKTFKTRFVK